jgi:hypothetical protein
MHPALISIPLLLNWTGHFIKIPHAKIDHPHLRVHAEMAGVLRGRFDESRGERITYGVFTRSIQESPVNMRIGRPLGSSKRTTSPTTPPPVGAV